MNQDEHKRIMIFYYKPFLIAQVLGLALDVFLLITLAETLEDIIYAVLLCPIFMGWLRLSVSIFRVLRNNWGWIISGTITLLAELFLAYIVLRITFVTQLSMILTLILLIFWSIYTLALDIRAVMTGDRNLGPKHFRLYTIIISAILVIIIATVCLFAWRNGKYEKTEKNKTSEIEITSVAPEMEMKANDVTTEIVESLAQKSLLACQQYEEDDNEDGFSILNSSSVEKVLFLKAKDGEHPHMDYGSNTKMYNTVVVITGYEIKHDGVPSMERQEWLLWFYPNYCKDENNLNYASEDEFSKYLNDRTLSEIEIWLAEEYGDMTVSELTFS